MGGKKPPFPGEPGVTSCSKRGSVPFRHYRRPAGVLRTPRTDLSPARRLPMPDLDQDSSSTPSTVPPAVPATIDPAAFEDYAVFRESFLMYISEPAFNASLRVAAEHFFTMMLESYDRWPAWQETSTRTEMRAAVADLRHLQGFLASIGQERELYADKPKRLGSYGGNFKNLLQISPTLS